MNLDPKELKRIAIIVTVVVIVCIVNTLILS